MVDEVDNLSQPLPTNLRGSPASNASGDTTDPERGLRDGLRGALAEVGVRAPDEEALLILRAAALLTPDDARPEISTTRLFVGVIEVGRELNQLRSYPAALAMVIESDGALKSSFDKILKLFGRESAEAALERLRLQWFSRNANEILASAMRNQGNAPFSEALARTLLTHHRGLLYGRISVNDIARAMPSQDIFQQIDQTLSSLQIAVTPRVRGLLLHAAELRQSDERLDLVHLYQALLDAGRASEPPIRPTDPTAMFEAAARKNEVSRDGQSSPTR